MFYHVFILKNKYIGISDCCTRRRAVIRLHYLLTYIFFSDNQRLTQSGYTLASLAFYGDFGAV